MVSIRVLMADGTDFDRPVQLIYTLNGEPNGLGIITPSDEGEVDLIGLEFGDYVFTANSPPDLASIESVQATLSEDSPGAVVDLVLSPNRYTVGIEAPDGTPSPVPMVMVGNRGTLPTTPGVFELQGETQGSALVVPASPGWAPVCKILGSEQAITIIPPPGTGSLLIHVPAQWNIGTSSAIGDLIGLQGSNCPVPISSYRIVETTEIGTWIEVSDLPLGPAILRPRRGQDVRLEVPGEPVVIEDRNSD